MNKALIIEGGVLRTTITLENHRVWMLALLLNSVRQRVLRRNSNSWAHLNEREQRCKQLRRDMRYAEAPMPKSLTSNGGRHEATI